MIRVSKVCPGDLQCIVLKQWALILLLERIWKNPCFSCTIIRLRCQLERLAVQSLKSNVQGPVPRAQQCLYGVSRIRTFLIVLHHFNFRFFTACGIMFWIIVCSCQEVVTCSACNQPVELSDWARSDRQLENGESAFQDERMGGSACSFDPFHDCFTNFISL